MAEVELTKVNHYENWLRSEGIPVVRGFFVEDVNSVKLGKWPRKEGLGAYINFDACAGIVNCYVCEIPPGSKLAPQKHLFEEIIYVLKGRGHTSVWNKEGAKQTFEWGDGSLFAIPLNVTHQHFNGSGSAPARYVAVTTAPLMINFFRNLEFVFDNPFLFKDRYSGRPEYWSKEGKVLGRMGGHRLMQTNLVPNLMALEIPKSSDRGSRIGYIDYSLAGSSLAAYVAEVPVGGYFKAHRHGPSAHILFLAGKGYTLFWREGEEKTRVDWKPGSMVVPPNQIFHQHFDTSNVPGRSLRFTLAPTATPYTSFGDLAWPTTDVDQIKYESEDPEIRRLFEAELAKSGVKPTTPH